MTPPVTILVVEDEPIIRMDIAIHLSDAGFEVLEAGNAADALVCLGNDPSIKVVMTDVDMPGQMDGLGLAARITQAWPLVRIIVVSGEPNATVAAMPDGCVFFDKPYRNDAIEACIRGMLDP